MEPKKWLDNLCTVGKTVPHDAGIKTIGKDTKVNEHLAQIGLKAIHKNLFTLILTQFCGLYLLMYVKSIVRVLYLTGQSKTPFLAFRRYLGTLNHAMEWYKGEDTLKTSLKTVLSMHRAAARKTQAGKKDPSMSQFDMVVTQWAFIGPFNLFPAAFGVRSLTPEESEGANYILYLVGKYLGICEEFNLCGQGAEKAKAYSRQILEQVIQPSLRDVDSRSEEMANTLLAGVHMVNPILVPDAFHLYCCRVVKETDVKSDFSHLSSLGVWMYRFQLLVLNNFMHSAAERVCRPLLNLLVRLNIMLCNESVESNKANKNQNENLELTPWKHIETLVTMPFMILIGLAKIMFKKIYA